MKSLIKYSNILPDFIEYSKTNKYPTESILSTDNLYFTLGYILSYLSYKRIYILCDTYNYYIYTDKAYIDVEITKDFVITVTDNENENDIIENYKNAIHVAFEFLNTPF